MKNELREIPKKNYIFVGIISVVTIFALVYFAFWYKNNKKYYDTESILSGYLAEIQEEGIIDNLTNYLIDNPNILLYISFGNDSSTKEFENEFKDLINKHNIISEFIYIDLNLITDKNFVSDMKSTFFSDKLKNINLEKQSNLLLFENGKVANVLYSSKQQINIADVERFLIRHGVIKND